MSYEERFIKYYQDEALREIGYFEPYHQDVVRFLKNRNSIGARLIGYLANGLISIGSRLQDMIEIPAGQDWQNDPSFNHR